MKRDSPDPLSPEIWLNQLASLQTACSREDSSFEDRAIRRAFHLAELCPRPLRTLIAPYISEDELETLLEKQQFEEAAEIVTRQHVAAIRSEADWGRYTAAMRMDPQRHVKFEAASKALAMIGAWAGFFTEMQRSQAEPGL